MAHSEHDSTVLSRAVVSPGRNAPCFCGSGKRYKECHGAIGADPGGANTAERLDRAMRLLREGEIDAATALAGEVLAVYPDHPAAHRVLGRCEFERGYPDAALRALLRAMRGLASVNLPAKEQFALWTDLNFMFTQALAGMDGTLGVYKRALYTSWLRSLHSDSTGATPRITIVLIVPGIGPGLERTLDSIHRQTYRNIELMIVCGRGVVEGDVAGALSDCPFTYCVLSVADASEAALINAGVLASSGAFVNVLRAGQEFAPERIGTLVREVAARGAVWGFTGVEFIDGDGRPVGRDADSRTLRWRDLLSTITQADTIGFALINQDFVAVDVGSLFFARTLFDELGGMRDLACTAAWDFALRAVWLAEPLYVPSTLYRHCVALSGAQPGKEGYEAAQLSMFREFYARACGGAVVAPNPFAPCIHHWGLHFLKTPFQTGHVLMFSREWLEQLAEMISARRVQPQTAELTPGLNLVGFAFGEFGLGESLRALANACTFGGVPCCVRDLDMRLNARQADRSIASMLADDAKYHCSLYCMNPDMLKPARQVMVSGAEAGIYSIGYWYWELEHLPREWAEGLTHMDEIWVASEFVADAVRSSTAKPVTKVPPPIEVTLSRPYRRSDFQLPEDRFIFLFSFDFNSFPIRKNPEGIIFAFRRAFESGRRDVGLVMKSINGSRRSEELHKLQDLIGGDDRIAFVDEFFTRDQVWGLFSVVDAYVSLHRSEGLGLGLAESMYLGKPVIGTAYSGNLEFMDGDNSCLVDYELVPVRKGQYLYEDERFRWANPDVEQAAHYMRRLVDDADFRDRIARSGQRTIRTSFSRAAAAARIRQRLEELGLL